MGPEAAAILAHAPALGLEPAFARGGRERARRQAGLPVLLDIEAGEGGAQDLGLRIALDALRAGIPAGDQARGVEHVDRIVVDGLDEQAGPAARGEGIFQAALLGHAMGLSRRNCDHS